LNDFIGWVVLLAVAGFLVWVAEEIGFGLFASLAILGFVGLWLRHKMKPQRDAANNKSQARKLRQQAKKFAPNEKKLFARFDDAGLAEDEFIKDLALAVLTEEGLFPPDKKNEPLDALSADHGRYRDQLKAYCEMMHRDEKTEQLIDDIVCIIKPFYSNNEHSVFDTMLPLSRDDVISIVVDIREANKEYGTFAKIWRQISKNYRMADCTIDEYKDDDYIDTYLGKTPFQKLRRKEGSVDLNNRTRHMMIIGGSGAGKTNLIEHIICHDFLQMFDKDVEENCHVVVIDSQRQLIPKLATIDLKSKLVSWLNPEWDMGINLFDVGWEKLNKREKEEVVNTTVGLIQFVMAGTLKSAMTDQQEVVFRYVIQLVITIPKGNLITLYKIMEEGGIEPYRQYIKELTNAGQDFFNKEWDLPRYKTTREALRSRIHILLNNPTFERIFSATETRFDLFEEIQNRSLILLDTHKPALKQEGSSFLGRLYIAMLVQAAHRRFETKDGAFDPVHVYIDEAHEYFDQSIAEMLEQARKANIGVTVAHQDLAQIKRRPGLEPATVIGCTATKLVATSLPEDAAVMAKAMRVRTDDILDLPTYYFGHYDKEQGFSSVKAENNPLQPLLYKRKEHEVRKEMEARYGVRKDAATPAPNKASADRPDETGDSADLPDVEPI